jgi:hypothetical protein
VWRRLVWLITFAAGSFFLLEFVLPAKAPAWLGAFENPLTPFLDSVTKFLIVVATMAFLLGPLNLVKRHLPTALHLRKGWFESVVFLVFLALGMVAQACHAEGRTIVTAAQAVLERLYGTLFYGLMLGFGASSMALLAFYLVSAAHRAFRVSNLEAGLMMTSAVIILLGQVPLGDWLTASLPESLQLPAVAQWILTVPNTAVQRAVLLGACGGAFAAAVRQWLGVGSQQG